MKTEDKYPILFHSHGIGDIDFSSMKSSDLEKVQEDCILGNVSVVPTIFLRREYLGEIKKVLTRYSAGRERFSRILGFAIEGPLLGIHGGVPPAGCWTPTAGEWSEICSLGESGLQYMVLGPDAANLDDEICVGTKFADLLDKFSKNGVKIAIGHFRHNDPELSAQRTASVIDHLTSSASDPKNSVITDHLYNDMPRAFKHAWRTNSERANRLHELRRVIEPEWTQTSVEKILGPVPALIIERARSGAVLPMLNFDDAHVDLAICKKTIEYVGADRVIAITDHTETTTMAGEPLYSSTESTLLRRGDGMVAAGTTGIYNQIENMRKIRLSDLQIDHLTRISPAAALRRIYA